MLPRKSFDFISSRFAMKQHEAKHVFDFDGAAIGGWTARFGSFACKHVDVHVLCCVSGPLVRPLGEGRLMANSVEKLDCPPPALPRSKIDLSESRRRRERRVAKGSMTPRNGPSGSHIEVFQQNWPSEVARSKRRRRVSPPCRNFEEKSVQEILLLLDAGKDARG